MKVLRKSGFLLASILMCLDTNGLTACMMSEFEASE